MYRLVLFLFLLQSACTGSVEGGLDTNQKPNIVFLFADDLTYEAIGALGNKIIETPNLDKLVKSGTTFSHAYNMGGWNGAVCTASRAMMISGRSIWKARDISKQWSAKDSSALNQTWGKLMQAAGYDTYMSGKWHVQAPAGYVFQKVKNIRAGMPGDHSHKVPGIWNKVREAYKKNEDLSLIRPAGYFRPIDENDMSWLSYDTLNGGFWKGGKHWSEVLKDDALEFLSEASAKDSPFFMYLSFNAPHDPRQAPRSFLEKYPLDDIPVPENFMEQYPDKDGIGSSPALRDEALAPFPRTPYAVKTHIREYYAIISHLDEQIGKILNALEASGKADNTYIFFTGDHGLSVGHHGLLGKQNMYDHSMRVPLMMVGPGIAKGKVIESDVYLQDIMATTLDVAGITKPDYVDFHSLVNLADETLDGNYQNGVYGAYIDLQRMIRKEGFKLIVYPKIQKVKLFNLNDDPLEMHDLSGQAAYNEKRNSLLKDLIELQREMDDPLDLSSLL